MFLVTILFENRGDYLGIACHFVSKVFFGVVSQTIEDSDNISPLLIMHNMVMSKLYISFGEAFGTSQCLVLLFTGTEYFATGIISS